MVLVVLEVVLVVLEVVLQLLLVQLLLLQLLLLQLRVLLKLPSPLVGGGLFLPPTALNNSLSTPFGGVLPSWSGWFICNFQNNQTARFSSPEELQHLE